MVLDGCGGLEEGALGRLMGGLDPRKLSELALVGCAGIDDGALVRAQRVRGWEECAHHTQQEGLARVAGLRLRSLDLSWASITDAGAAALASGGGVGPLATLVFKGCDKLVGEGLTAVTERYGGTLRVLDLFGCFKLQASALCAAARHCSALEVLCVAQCPAVDATVAAATAELRSLDVRGCRQVGDAALVAVARSCPGLVCLRAAQCELVTDAGVGSLAQCQGLTVLDLRGCRCVSNTALASLMTLPLVELDLSRTAISGPAVVALARPGLQRLGLGYCSGVRAATVVAVLHAAPDLHEIGLQGCSGISTNERRALLGQRPGLKVVG